MAAGFAGQCQLKRPDVLCLQARRALGRTGEGLRGDCLRTKGEKQMKRLGLVVAGTLCAGAAFGDFAEYVDPFTGTAGTGHTHPAACVPFGMVQAGPDTGCNDWAYCSGYQFRDKSVLGYSLTHLSGTGCPDYGDVQILPFTGAFGPMPMRRAMWPHFQRKRRPCSSRRRFRRRTERGRRRILTMRFPAGISRGSSLRADAAIRSSSSRRIVNA